MVHNYLALGWVWRQAGDACLGKGSPGTMSGSPANIPLSSSVPFLWLHGQHWVYNPCMIKNAQAVIPCTSIHFSFHIFMNNFTSYFVLASRKICCRCGKIYGVTSTGKHCRVEECNYHFGPVLSHKGKCLVVVFHWVTGQCPSCWGKSGMKYSLHCMC